ncbi:MAG TPA: hypothetical protein DCS93_02705 [Microscillaceae bacterium]|nr:hypothetical protein [Microscillaceae bacterium]
MNPTAVISFNGTPVKIKSEVNGYDFTDNYVLSHTGTLFSFVTNDIEYFFLRRIDLLMGHQRLADQSKNTYTPGYYRRDSYLKYRRGQLSLAKLRDEKTVNGFIHRFVGQFEKKEENWGFEEATLGDLVIFKRLSPQSPYTTYYQNKKYIFKISPSFEGKGFTYLNDFPPIDANESSETYSTITVEDININPAQSASPHFYKENFGDVVNSDTWDEEVPDLLEDDTVGINDGSTYVTKKEYAMYMTRMCWRISYIIKNVLPKIAINPIADIELFYWDHLRDIDLGITPEPDSDYNSLPDSDKAVAVLLHDWGSLNKYGPPIHKTFKAILPLNPDIEQWQAYRNALDNFYYNLFYLREEEIFPTDPNLTLEQDSDRRLIRLIEILPLSALALFPLQAKIDILRSIAKGDLPPELEIVEEIYTYGGFTKIKDRIPYQEELLVLKIFNTIKPHEVDSFLDQLVSIKVEVAFGQVTLFEALYKEVSDSNDRLLTFHDNRKKLMKQMYILWYVSKYNPQEVLEGEDYTASETLYENFNNAPVSLNYNPEKFWGFYLDNMDFSFQGDKILVKEDDKEATNTYNFYQAISLRNYEENSTAIKVPMIAVDINGNGTKSALIPLFFLKYMDDFGDKDDIWHAVGLAFDIALTFTGIGNLAKLRHLRHLSKLRKLSVLGGSGLSAGERILVLEAVTGLAGVAELTASIADIILKYYTDGCKKYQDAVKQVIKDGNEQGKIPDNSEYEFCKKLDSFLFWVQIASAGTDLISSLMVRKAARKIIDEGVPNDFLILKNDQDIRAYDVVLKFAVDLSQAKPIFKAKIKDSLGGVENSKLWQDFNNLSEADQVDFLVVYGKTSGSNIKRMYKGEEELSAIGRWDEINKAAGRKVKLKNLFFVSDDNVWESFTWVNKNKKNLFSDYSYLDPEEIVALKYYTTQPGYQSNYYLRMRSGENVSIHPVNTLSNKQMDKYISILDNAFEKLPSYTGSPIFLRLEKTRLQSEIDQMVKGFKYKYPNFMSVAKNKSSAYFTWDKPVLISDHNKDYNRLIMFEIENTKDYKVIDLQPFSRLDEERECVIIRGQTLEVVDAEYKKIPLGSWDELLPHQIKQYDDMAQAGQPNLFEEIKEDALREWATHSTPTVDGTKVNPRAISEVEYDALNAKRKAGNASPEELEALERAETILTIKMKIIK